MWQRYTFIVDVKIFCVIEKWFNGETTLHKKSTMNGDKRDVTNQSKLVSFDYNCLRAVIFKGDIYYLVRISKAIIWLFESKPSNFPYPYYSAFQQQGLIWFDLTRLIIIFLISWFRKKEHTIIFDQICLYLNLTGDLLFYVQVVLQTTCIWFSNIESRVFQDRTDLNKLCNNFQSKSIVTVAKQPSP